MFCFVFLAGLLPMFLKTSILWFTKLGGICSVIRWGTIPFLFILILNSGSCAQELDRIDSPNPFVSTILQ